MFVETGPGQYRRLDAYDGITVEEHRKVPGSWVVIGHRAGATGAILATFGNRTAAEQWLWQTLADAELLAVPE